MPNTTIVYNADTASFVRNMDTMKKSLLATGDASDRVKAKILENTQQQIEAALQLGKSQGDLDRITQKAAERMASVTTQSAARQEAALDRLIGKQKATAAELEKLGRAKAPDSGHGFTDRMALSSVVRAGEGNPGIRSIENFLAMSPKVAAAAQSIAPLIGGAGLAAMFVEMGIKGYEAFQKIQHAAEEERRVISDQHQTNLVAIDDHELMNQKLQDEIDKLGGHPNNGVAKALLEAKQMADKLLLSLHADRNELQAFFKEHEQGYGAKILNWFGLAPDGTTQTDKEMLKDYDKLNDKLSGRRATYEASMRSAKDDKDRKRLTHDYNRDNGVDIQQVVDSWQAEAVRLGKTRNGFTQAGDSSIKVEDLNAGIEKLKTRKRIEELDDSIYDKNTTLGGLRQHKGDDEAQRKADEAQRKQWEGQDAQRNVSGNDSAVVEVNIWAQRVASLKVGSDQYIYALKELSEKLSEARRKDVEEQKQAATAAQKAQRDQWDTMHDSWVSAGQRSAQDEADFWTIRLLEAEHGSENFRRAYDKLTEAELAVRKQAQELRKQQDRDELANSKRAGAAAEAALNIDKRQGTVSPFDYASQQASIHTQEYLATQKDLQKQLDDASATGNPLDIDRAKQAIIQEDANRVIQINEDAANIVATTWEGSLKNAFANWAQDATDTAKQITEVSLEAVNELNSNLASAMTGGKTNWSGMFRGLSKTLAEDSLKQVEGTALKALGVGGKADGSAANPFHVIDVGSGGSKGVDSALSNLLGGGDSDKAAGAGSTVGSGVGKVLGVVAGIFGGGLALGGPAMPGVAYDVGEMGREQFVPSVPGVIIPHNQLGDGAARYTINVADGVTPEQLHMHVSDALRQFHPIVVRDSVMASREAGSRRPSTKS